MVVSERARPVFRRRLEIGGRLFSDGVSVAPERVMRSYGAEAMLAGRPMSAMVSQARAIVDQTPVGDTFLLIQNVQAFFEMRAQEQALERSRGSR
jgi:hypothetical protein